MLAFLFPGYHHIAIALWYIVGRILNMCFAHMRPPRPRRGVFHLISLPHTQFHLRVFPISFRFWFFCLLFSAYAHAVVFSPLFFSLTPSFISVSFRLASGFGFSACFSPPTPTPWVFPLYFCSANPDLRFGKSIKNITESTYTERDVEWLREDLEKMQ